MASKVLTQGGRPSLRDWFWAWFGHYADADVKADNRYDMHLQRIEHHENTVWKRINLLIPTVGLAVLLIIAGFAGEARLGVVIGIAVVIGISVGVVLTSIVHHLRKISYHKFRIEPPPEE